MIRLSIIIERVQSYHSDYQRLVTIKKEEANTSRVSDAGFANAPGQEANPDRRKGSTT